MQERDIRARNRMEQVLGDFLSVLSATDPRPLSLAQIAELCRDLWSDSKVTIPANDEGVAVTDSPGMIGSADTLFVMGMLEGTFPRRRSEDPVLDDFEREELGDLLGVRLKTSHDRSRAERDAFYRVCAAAGNRLVFSYPETDDQRDNIPAFYLRAVEDAAGEGNFRSVEHVRPLLAPMPDECLTDADIILRAALDGPRSLPLDNHLATDAARRAVTPDVDEPFSPAELRDALQCPYQYVARHRLGLKARHPQARWSGLRRLPEMADLSSQADAEAARGALVGALDAELDLMYSELPEWEAELIRSGGRRLIDDWVRREFKAREKWPKQEGSLKKRARFGEELCEAMPGGTRLRGSVAAVSRLGPYRVAHLYGSSSPEGPDLEDRDKLYYGLHLLALHDSRSEVGLEIESMQGKRLLLILGRSPGKYLPGDAAEGLRVIDLASSDDTVAAKRDFFRDVKDLLRKATDAISEGSVEPRRGEHCAWCDYGELCRRSFYFREEDSPFDDWRAADV